MKAAIHPNTTALIRMNFKKNLEDFMADIYTRMNKTLDDMLYVYNHLKQNSFQAMRSDIGFSCSIARLKDFFHLSANDTALFTCIFVAYFENDEKPVSMTNISDSLGASALRILEFRSCFDALEAKGFVTSYQPREHFMPSKYYRVPKTVSTAVLKGDEKLLEKSLHAGINDKDLTYPDSIAEKELFYSDENKDDIKALFTYLEETHFTEIQKRLTEKKLPKGVCVMLHGASGSGKTETVYQLAKKTGRALYHVDIGATISQWVGGTEQHISMIFDKYERMCKQSRASGGEIPILLFNEADALFGCRITSPIQGHEISENHIQSILLDYIEKQSGILIVTTNLADNFDKAFERRFLFKINFEAPNLEVKRKIWENKATWLHKQAIAHLAENYALTGAQIENVVRKATMKEILTGIKSSAKEIEAYCQKERLESIPRSTIGFGR